MKREERRRRGDDVAEDHAAVGHEPGVGRRADELHDIGLKALYKSTGNTDPMAFFVGNEIYDHLEKVVDRFDDVANVMHGIVIEHV